MVGVAEAAKTSLPLSLSAGGLPSPCPYPFLPFLLPFFPPVTCTDRGRCFASGRALMHPTNTAAVQSCQILRAARAPHVKSRQILRARRAPHVKSRQIFRPPRAPRVKLCRIFRPPRAPRLGACQIFASPGALVKFWRAMSNFGGRVKFSAGPGPLLSPPRKGVMEYMKTTHIQPLTT